jgi:glycosyltransferase involved in cell wall biosynthesis
MVNPQENLKISIITCTYNSEKFLPQALESIERQTYPNIEHIINDSYSTDGTLAIIQDYIKRNGARYAIKFMQSQARGVGNALNTATAAAAGEIIHYLHSDDYYLDENALARAAGHFNANPDLVWLTGNFVVEWRGKKLVLPQTLILQPNLEIALSVMNFISHENTFMKREVVQHYGGFVETKIEPVEYSLWLKLLKDHQPLILNDEFTVFIIHKGSTSTGNIFKLMKAMGRAFKAQRNLQIIPLLGYYREKNYYKHYRFICRKVSGWASIFSSKKA